MLKKANLRICFEKLKQGTIYGQFEVYNDLEGVFLGGVGWFTISQDKTFLDPKEPQNGEFYAKLETIYRLFDFDLLKDIERFVQKLLNDELVDEIKVLN